MISIARLLIVTGLALTILGGLLLVIQRSGGLIDNIPGDLNIEFGNLTCGLALGISILLSIILTVLLNIFAKFFN